MSQLETVEQRNENKDLHTIALQLTFLLLIKGKCICTGCSKTPVTPNTLDGKANTLDGKAQTLTQRFSWFKKIYEISLAGRALGDRAPPPNPLDTNSVLRTYFVILMLSRYRVQYKLFINAPFCESRTKKWTVSVLRSVIPRDKIKVWTVYFTDLLKNKT